MLRSHARPEAGECAQGLFWNELMLFDAGYIIRMKDRIRPSRPLEMTHIPTTRSLESTLTVILCG